MKFFRSLVSILAIFFVGQSIAQITVTNTQTPEQLVNNVLAGGGVTIIPGSIEFNASVPNAQGVQVQVGYFDATGTTFPIPEGIIMASGNVAGAVGPNTQGGATDNTGALNGSDPDLDAISTAAINNGAILEFDFIPAGDTLSFEYIFGSDEYHEFAPSNYNDAFGFFLSGPGIAGPYTNMGTNIAIIPGTALPVTINNLNNGNSNTGPCENCAFLTDNGNGPDVEYDAYTVVMTASASVQCGETYHMKLVIGDAGDASYDSGVFLEANSFSSNEIQVDISTVSGDTTIAEGCDTATITFIRPEGSVGTILDITYDIDGTATNGVDYNNLSGNVTFPVGEDSVSFEIIPVLDGAEPAESVIITVYTVNACGDTIANTGTLWIVDPPAYTIVTNDITITCPEDTVLLSVGSTGGVPDLEYTWQHGPTGTDIYVDGSTTAAYTVDVVDACGVTSQGIVNVNFNPNPLPTIAFNNNTFTICPGEQVEMIGSAQGAVGNVNYDWEHEAGTTNNANSFVNPLVETWYYLDITDDCYSVRDSVKVELGEADIASIAITNATGCPPNHSNDNGEVLIVTNPNSGMDVTLTNDGNVYNLNTPPYNFTSLTGGMTAQIHIEDANGCTADSLVIIGVGLDPLTFDLVADSLRDVSCFGMTDGGAYIDNISGGTGPYTVTWTPTSGAPIVNSTNGPDFDIDNLYGSDWGITVTNQEGCSFTYPFTINSPTEIVLTYVAQDPSCHHSQDNGAVDGSISLSVSGGTPGYTYIWSDSEGNTQGSQFFTWSAIDSGSYHVDVIDQNNCMVSEDIILNEPDSMFMIYTTTEESCFELQNATLILDSLNVNTDLYDFVLEPLGTSGPIWTHLDPTINYTLTAQPNSTLFCNIEGVSITYTPAPPYQQTPIVQPSRCTPVGGEGSVVAIDLGESFYGGLDNSNSYWYAFVPDSTVIATNTTVGNVPAGTYYFYGTTSNNNCKIYDTVVVDLVPFDADFSVDTTWAIAPHSFDFENLTVVDFDIADTATVDEFYRWYFDGNLINANNFESYAFEPDTTITNPDTIEVCLVYDNGNNSPSNQVCLDTVCKVITIVPPLNSTVPNVFTPDGDGINDEYFFPADASSIAEFSCTIFNRWGKKMFEMDHISQSWNGKLKGTGGDAAEGVYHLEYRIVGVDNIIKEGQSIIHIIRGN